MICSFAKEFSTLSYTNIENSFIQDYMPSADGNAVKVYLYGLFLCAHPEIDESLENFAEKLNISLDTLKEYFEYWEEYGILSVISKDPFEVKYMPIGSQFNKPRKYKAEKYTEFTKGLQALLPNRMISTGEYTEYFTIMENYKILPDAMLMIVKYCADSKGGDISYHFISKVAKDYGERGINTVELVEKELSWFNLRTNTVKKILSAMSSKKMPDIDDFNLYKKWTQELMFEPDNIVFAAKCLKKGNMEKLDTFMHELFSMKSFSQEEIKEYVDKKQSVYDLAIKINRALSIYVDVLDTEIDTYIRKWLSYGFDEQTLLYLSSHCFKTGKNNLQYLDTLITTLYENGVIDLSSVGDYFTAQQKSDEFISKYLICCGLTRRPTDWDRNNLKTWRSWNFSDDMIMEAAKISAGKSSPVAYMYSVLSNWKNNNVFSPSLIDGKENVETSQADYNSEYARRRAKALSVAQKNTDKAMQIDGFSAVYERIFSIEKDLAFAEMSKNNDILLALEKEKTEVLQKANRLLSAVNLTLDDLSPKYACEKCQDTGYIGTHRCDCFNK